MELVRSLFRVGIESRDLIKYGDRLRNSNVVVIK